MTLKIFACAAAVVVAAFAPRVVDVAIPQDAPKPAAAPQDAPKPASAPKDAEAAAAAGWARYMKLMQPSEHHEWFDRLLGDWDFSTVMTMGGAKQPMGSGKATFKRLYGKAWVAREYKGTLMGRPAEGLTIYGYDNYKNKYVSNDVSSQRTNMLAAEGMLDRTESALALYGPMDEPLSDEHDKPVKYLLRVVDKDKLIEEVHDLAIGETGTKVIEVVYTRAK